MKPFMCFFLTFFLNLPSFHANEQHEPSSKHLLLYKAEESHTSLKGLPVAQTVVHDASKT